MGRLEDLPAESRAELEEFAAHLKQHRDVAQLYCRFCLLRLSRPSAASPAQEATPPREQEQHQGWTKNDQRQEPMPKGERS